MNEQLSRTARTTRASADDTLKDAVSRLTDAVKSAPGLRPCIDMNSMCDIILANFVAVWPGLQDKAKVNGIKFETPGQLDVREKAKVIVHGKDDRFRADIICRYRNDGDGELLFQGPPCESAGAAVEALMTLSMEVLETNYDSVVRTEPLDDFLAMNGGRYDMNV